MADSFYDIGKIEALRQLYEGTPFTAFAPSVFETDGRSGIISASRVLVEGIDFNLVYFPLKHLGYKSVLAVTGELYASLARPRTLSVILGISSKLDFPQIREIWSGIVAAASEHSFASVALDLVPSPNGLSLSVSASGEIPHLTSARAPKPKTKDLICISGRLGAAYLGLRVLENASRTFEKEGTQPDLEKYRMIVGAYLKPELEAGLPERLETSEIYPSAGVFITRGLSDAVKRITRSTGLGAKIYADKIPFEGNSFALGKELDIDPVSAAMNGGDDYQLLYTVPILSLERFRRDFQTFDIIGHLAENDVGEVLVTPEGAELPIRAQGWDNE